MSVGQVYLAVSLLGGLLTLTGLLRAKRLGPLMPLHFLVGWLVSELPLFHLGAQALLTLAFAAGGALAEPAGQWGLAVTFASWAGLLLAQARALPSEAIFRRALEEGLGTSYLVAVPEERRATLRSGVRATELARPFAMRRPGVEVVRNLSYGAAGERNQLDVYRPAQAGQRRPVLLQIHGGGWTIGKKEEQALPLMNHLVERGWVCVAANYRLSPKARFPDHIVDVKRAIAWIRAQIADYGGDPDFVVITGGSAGGHLAALAALTPNDPLFQPGFEDVDTTLSGCVPFYGVFDFLDRNRVRVQAAMRPFLESRVMPGSPEALPELWEKASPIAQVGPHAPPFFVIQGTHDSLVFVEEARVFVDALRAATESAVVYAELPGAQHAFEIFHSLRADEAVNAAARFVEYVYAQRRAAEESPKEPAVAAVAS